LVTFGKDAEQPGVMTILFRLYFLCTGNLPRPLFIRVFDPDIGGTFDEQQGVWNTRTTFSVFGGKGACSNEDARRIKRDGNFKSGTMLASRLLAKMPGTMENGIPLAL
jgi:hypothetical protein